MEDRVNSPDSCPVFRRISGKTGSLEIVGMYSGASGGKGIVAPAPAAVASPDYDDTPYLFTKPRKILRSGNTKASQAPPTPGGAGLAQGGDPGI